MQEKFEKNFYEKSDTSPETIFNTMSVYFLAAKVMKTKYTLAGTLISTMAGIAASVVLKVAGKAYPIQTIT